jgi:putative ABC transport system ATP-binding protein
VTHGSHSGRTRCTNSSRFASERRRAIIKLERVSKNHDNIGRVTVPALHDVELSIETGEMVAVIGDSGSGTSTLLNILGCLDTPTSGRYIPDGRDLSGLSKRQLNDVRATTVGFAFHLAPLRGDTTIVRNVELPMVFALRARERHRRAMHALDLVGLGGHAAEMPVELSPAQRRRAIIARALINRPKVMLQDEPTADPDDESGAEILELLAALHAEGTTVVFSTKASQVAAKARRTVRLVDGRIQRDGGTAPALDGGDGLTTG